MSQTYKKYSLPPCKLIIKLYTSMIHQTKETQITTSLTNQNFNNLKIQNQFHQGDKHLFQTQKIYMDNLLHQYKNILSDGHTLGNFKLFSATIHLIPNQQAIQPKRNIDFTEKVDNQIQKFIDQGVITLNTSKETPTISNIVLINKVEVRLTKADKTQLKRERAHKQTKTTPTFRITLDLTLTNTILLGTHIITQARRHILKTQKLLHEQI